MLISLLLIIVPTILILAVMIPYINTRNKRVLKEIGELKKQLEQLGNVSVPETKKKKAEPDYAEPDIRETDKDEKEEKDAEITIHTETDASEYNTGKSGKTYTKEELELLIKE